MAIRSIRHQGYEVPVHDLNQKFLVSKEIIDLLQMKEWQSESMGEGDLKGKNENIELFALKI